MACAGGAPTKIRLPYRDAVRSGGKVAVNGAWTEMLEYLNGSRTEVLARWSWCEAAPQECGERFGTYLGIHRVG